MNSERTCGTCVNWQPRQNREMGKHRLAACVLGERCVFLPAHRTCERHKLASPQDVAKRIAWLAR